MVKHDITIEVAAVSSREEVQNGTSILPVETCNWLRNFTTAALRSFTSCAATCLVILIGITAGHAKVHPVPLEKNVDAATCLQCHEDKSKGKSVHTAIQTGCLSCHEVRVNKDVTRVKLNTAVPYKLCLTCHTDKDVAQVKGHVHPPAVRDCLSCHDPHTSDNKNQLIKATSGDKKENLCLS